MTQYRSLFLCIPLQLLSGLVFASGRPALTVSASISAVARVESPVGISFLPSLRPGMTDSPLIFTGDPTGLLFVEIRNGTQASRILIIDGRVDPSPQLQFASDDFATPQIITIIPLSN